MSLISTLISTLVSILVFYLSNLRGLQRNHFVIIAVPPKPLNVEHPGGYNVAANGNHIFNSELNKKFAEIFREREMT